MSFTEYLQVFSDRAAHTVKSVALVVHPVHALRLSCSGAILFLVH